MYYLSIDHADGRKSRVYFHTKAECEAYVDEYADWTTDDIWVGFLLEGMSSCVMTEWCEKYYFGW